MTSKILQIPLQTICCGGGCCLVTESCLTLCNHQAPLSIGLPRQEYWSGLPFPSPGDLPNPRVEPTSPALAGRFFTTEPSGKPITIKQVLQ